jgi:hypothetical protein
VLPVDLSAFVDLGDGTGWPLTLAFPTDGGLWLPRGMFHALECDNDDRLADIEVAPLRSAVLQLQPGGAARSPAPTSNT